MKKPILITVIVIGILVLVTSGIFLLSRNVKTTTLPKQTEITSSPTIVSRKLWDDQAGFTFTYNPDLKIDKHDEDQDNYAHLEMTNTGNTGEIFVWAKDTNALDVQAWVRTEKSFKDANIIDTSLGGQPAKKIVITNPTKKVITGTIYDGLLFYVENTGGDDTYWQDEYNQMINSFTFKPADSTSETNASDTAENGQAESYDEEETVE
jgi:hypothetical protein